MMVKKQKLRQERLKNDSIDEKRTFIEHLEDLKSRLVWVLYSIVVGSLVGYLMREEVIKVLLLSNPQPLFYYSPAGGLDFVIKISLLFGVIVAIPVFIFQIIMYLQPLFSKPSKFRIGVTVLFSLILLVAGMSFAYFVSLPAVFKFLSGFGNEQVKSLIGANEYLTFVSIYMLGFGIIFQLPLIMLVTNKIHTLQTRDLWRKEKYFILISFVIAAILTPTPDLVNQTIMAVPIIFLYQISIIIIWLTNKRKEINL